MHLTKSLTLIAAAGLLAACNPGGGGKSGQDIIPQSTRLEARLAANDDWPYEIAGILDVAYPAAGDVREVAVGALLTEDDAWGVSVSIDAAVLEAADIAIDSKVPVVVTLHEPAVVFGVSTYPVTSVRQPAQR